MTDADWAMTDLREAVIKRASHGEPGAHPEALSVPTMEAVDRLVDFLQYYDPDNSNLPDDPTNSFMYRWMMDRLESQLVYDASQNQHTTRMRGVAGRQSGRVDATGYEMLLNDIKPAAHQWIVKGQKGTGKTIKVLDIGKKAIENGIVEKVMTNIETKGFLDKFDVDFPEGQDVRFSEKISEMLMFAKEPGEKLIIIDEASTVLNMLGGDHKAQKIFTKIINALRKSEGGSTRLIIVGHKHDTDILPTLRNNTDIVMHADGKKEEGLIDKATVYEGWKEFKQEDSKYKVQGLQDISQNSPWRVDTNYFAWIDLDLDNPDKQIQRGALIDNWEDYQEDGEEAEEVNQDVEEIRRHQREEMALRLAERGYSYTEIGERMYEQLEGYNEPVPKRTVGDWVNRAKERAE